MRRTEWFDLVQYVDASKFSNELSGPTKCGKILTG